MLPNACYHYRMNRTITIRVRLALIAFAWVTSVFSAVAQQPEPACTPTVVGHLDILPLTSKIFHNERKLRVWLPPGYDDAANAQKKYPVLYMLDGQDVFDVCTSFGHEEQRVDETLTELITAGKIQPVIAVGVDNGSKFGEWTGQRSREYLPYRDPTDPVIKDVEGDRFPAFMETEVMPVIAAKYRILAGPTHTAIGGGSYGGVAAIYALIRRPDLFGSGLAGSPSLQIGNGQILRDTVWLNVGPSRLALSAGNAQFGPPFPHAAELNANYVHDIETLADHFRAIEVYPTNVQVTIREGARHTTPDIAATFRDAFIFLFPVGPTGDIERPPF